MASAVQEVSITGPAGPLRVYVEGEGPLVLLLHGFPESGRAWRLQLHALAAAGYRAAAPDLRGYGGSVKPASVEAYRMLGHVADNVAIVRELGAAGAAVVGHDWGSPIAAASALMRPDLFTAVGLLGVPYTPRGDIRPSQVFAQMGGEEEFYVAYFQQPGRAEAEIDEAPRAWLRGFAAALDGETPTPAHWFTVPRGAALRDRFPEGDSPPRWLPEAELDALAADLAAGGAAGPLNRYRNFDRDWEDLAAFAGRAITQPAIYIAGAADPSTAWLADAVARQAEWLPGLAGVHLLEGCGHWVQQERPEEVNALLVEWLAAARRG